MTRDCRDLLDDYYSGNLCSGISSSTAIEIRQELEREYSGVGKFCAKHLDKVVNNCLLYISTISTSSSGCTEDEVLRILDLYKEENMDLFERSMLNHPDDKCIAGSHGIKRFECVFTNTTMVNEISQELQLKYLVTEGCALGVLGLIEEGIFSV